MSYFFYSPVYSFMPYLCPQFYENKYPSAYLGFQNSENVPQQKIQQTQLSLNFQQDFDALKPNEDELDKNDSQSEKINEKKNKTKRRRGVDKQKELESAKKNSESNIINQYFSYFSCRTQSEQIVEKAIMMSVHKIEELQKILSIFYNIMKCMSLQRIKKYVNKKTLLNIFGRENIEKQIPEILQKFKTLTFITIDQICEVIRRCCFYFLRNISLISILASKRISTLSKREHLKKRRQLDSIVSGKL